jgi:phosphohistidine phosphatase SixA
MINLSNSIKEKVAEYLKRDLTADDIILFSSLIRTARGFGILRNEEAPDNMEEVLQALAKDGHIRYDGENITIKKDFLIFMVNVVDNAKQHNN